MKYIFDTNICIYILNKKYKSILERIEIAGIDAIGITAITIAELAYGIEKSQKKEENRIALMEFLLPFMIIDFTQADSYEYGKIRSNLEKSGQVIGNMDLLIASMALNRDIILVTNNVKEFERIEGLTIENWIEESNNNVKE